MKLRKQLATIEYDKNRNKIFGIKSAIIWGRKKESNGMTPILYISKPKHVSLEDFEDLLDNLKIEITKYK